MHPLSLHFLCHVAQFLCLLLLPSSLLTCPCSLHTTALALSIAPLETHASYEKVLGLLLGTNSVLQTFDLFFVFALNVSFALHIVAVANAHDRRFTIAVFIVCWHCAPKRTNSALIVELSNPTHLFVTQHMK